MKMNVFSINRTLTNIAASVVTNANTNNISNNVSTNTNAKSINLPIISGFIRKSNMMGSRTSRYMRRGIPV